MVDAGARHPLLAILAADAVGYSRLMARDETAALTALGLWLIVRSRQGWILRVGGGILLLLPHAIGAPQTAGPQVVPAGLVRDFAVASIVGNGAFWLVLGTVTGWLFPIKPGSDS